MRSNRNNRFYGNHVISNSFESQLLISMQYRVRVISVREHQSHKLEIRLFLFAIFSWAAACA